MARGFGASAEAFCAGGSEGGEGEPRSTNSRPPTHQPNERSLWRTPNKAIIYVSSARPATRKEILDYDPAGAFPIYDPTPAGDRFIMLETHEAPPDQLHVVLNWFDELKRLAPADN